MTHAQSSYYNHVKSCTECKLHLEMGRVSILCHAGFHLYKCAIDLMEPGKAQGWTDRISQEYEFWLMQGDFENGEAVTDLEIKVFDIRAEAFNLMEHLERVNDPQFQGLLGNLDAAQAILKSIGERFPKGVPL